MPDHDVTASMAPTNRPKRSPATQRAIARVRAGERPTYAAQAEGINPSTLFRALANDRPPRLVLVIAPENAGFSAWVADQRNRHVSRNYRFDAITDLEPMLPRFFEWMQTRLQQ